jgi:hypothetical protein
MSAHFRERFGVRWLAHRFLAWPTCRPGQAAFSGSEPGRASARLDGDKSPAESGENSPHSMTPWLGRQPRWANSCLSMFRKSFVE